MALIDEVKTRIGATNAYLIELTNYDVTVTTVNETVLQAACDDAEGLFEDITGLTPDVTSKVHLYHLVDATIYFLEQYKSRDSGIMSGRKSGVVSGMRALRGRQTLSPTSRDPMCNTDCNKYKKRCHQNFESSSFQIKEYNDC
jgi:hypothetical protein